MNQVIYEENGVPSNHIWGSVVRMIEYYKDVNSLEAKHKVNKKQQWEPPLEGFYLINVDGAIPLTKGPSGVGMLIRDWNRRVIAAVSMPLPRLSFG